MKTVALRTLAGFAVSYRGVLVISALIMVAESLAALAVPWVGGLVAEGMLSPRELDTRTLLLGLLALFAAQR